MMLLLLNSHPKTTLLTSIIVAPKKIILGILIIYLRKISLSRLDLEQISKDSKMLSFRTETASFLSLYT